MLNQARIQVLKTQEEHLAKLIEETRRRLSTVTKNEEKYGKLLQLLIAQGLFQMLEPELVIRCLKDDVPLVKDALKGALEYYTKMTKRECKVKVDEENYLGNNM
jgi:V-type H+-transporting ATPase subunit E